MVSYGITAASAPFTSCSCLPVLSCTGVYPLGRLASE